MTSPKLRQSRNKNEQVDLKNLNQDEITIIKRALANLAEESRKLDDNRDNQINIAEALLDVINHPSLY